MPMIDGAAVELQRGREGRGGRGVRERERGERELSSGHCDRKAEISSNHPSGTQLNIFF